MKKRGVEQFFASKNFPLFLDKRNYRPFSRMFVSTLLQNFFTSNAN